MGGNRGSYPLTALGRVAVAPLPPTPKITEIGCVSPDPLVSFANGWKQESCPVEVSVNGFYATVFVKGENLTKDWLTNAVKGAYYNNSEEIETTIGDIYDYEGGIIAVDINFSAVFGEGDTVKFEVDGVQSSWMPMYKAN